MQHHRHLEPARILGGKLPAVVTHGAVHAYRLDRRAQREATAKAETHHANFAVVRRVRGQPRNGCQNVCGDARAVGLGKQIARRLLVGGRATGRRQAIWRNRHVTLGRHAPCHV